MDSITRAKLRRLIEHADWDVIYSFASFISEKWNKAQVKGDDQFNTTWNIAHREGKINGIKEFLDTMEQLALNEDH